MRRWLLSCTPTYAYAKFWQTICPNVTQMSHIQAWIRGSLSSVHIYIAINFHQLALIQYLRKSFSYAQYIEQKTHPRVPLTAAWDDNAIVCPLLIPWDNEATH